MTQSLKKAIATISLLPDTQQDEIASIIMDEVAADKQWDDRFERDIEILDRLGEKAAEEHRAGHTLPLDPENM